MSDVQTQAMPNMTLPATICAGSVPNAKSRMHHTHAPAAMADTMNISSELCPRVKPAGLTEKVLSPEFLGIRLNRVEEVAAVETPRRDESQPADYMPRDERPGHVRLDDEKPADDRHGGDRIADGREKVFRGGGIGADDLADDGGGGAIERDADRAQEKEHGACREPRGVVAGGENVGRRRQKQKAAIARGMARKRMLMP